MSYTPTTWISNSAPALNAANLNKLTDELKSEAAVQGVSHSLPTWVNGSGAAVNDGAVWVEIDRVVKAVADSLSLSYAVSGWSSRELPSAAKLNNIELQLAANRDAMSTPAFGSALYARLVESSGTTYYVRTDGNNANNGLTNSAGGAWRTVDFAAENAPANSIVKVVAGNYPEQVQVARQISASTPITIEAQDPANRPVIGSLLMASSGTPSRGYRWRNLIFDVQLLDPDGSVAAGGTRYDCVKIGTSSTLNAESDIEIYGCELRNATGQGYNQQAVVTRVHVINCKIFNSGWQASAASGESHTMYLRHGTFCMYLNNILYGSVHGHTCQVYSDGDVAGLQDSIFANCVHDDSLTRTGQLIDQPTVVTQANLQQRNIWKNCLFTNNGTWGIEERNHAGLDPAAGNENLFDRCIRFGNGSGGSSSLGNAIFTNQINSDPLYVDEAGRDYHLQSGSPAINAGDIAYTPAYDFAGTSRVNPDIGPYAFV